MDAMVELVMADRIGDVEAETVVGVKVEAEDDDDGVDGGVGEDVVEDDWGVRVASLSENVPDDGPRYE